MRIESIFIQQGVFYTQKQFKKGFNLIFSEENSVGKSTLLRCMLYALGYNIPGTKGFKMETITTRIVLIYENERKIILERNGLNCIDLIEKGKRTSFSLPSEQNFLHSSIFATNNINVLNNILGAIYTDQEKGWTLLNRGKAIAGIRFNIDELIRGLSNRNCDDLIIKKKVVENNINKYKQILNISQYRDTIGANTSFVSNTYDREQFIKMSQLKVERDGIKAEINRINHNLDLNKKTIEFINDLKLIVRAPDGCEICVTTENTVGLTDSLDYLRTKKKMLLSDYNKISLELDKYNNFINEEDEQLSLFKSETLAEKFDGNLLNIPINSVDVQKVIDGLEKEKNLLKKEIHEKSILNNPITDSLHNTVEKYMKELGVANSDGISRKYLFTDNLKELTGAILHNTIFSFKLAYIIEIQKYLNIKLPIILDSPSGKEVDKKNVDKMMEILLRDFPDNQIIVASIYHYVENENVIELREQLLDSVISSE